MLGLAVHGVAGSILLWGHFPVEGIFPLELTWVQTPFPQKTPSDESINRGLVCAHMHFIARTQKILTFMPQTGECRQQKHTQHAPSTKTECDYLNGWIKKRSHTQKSHPKVVNPRDIAGERKWLAHGHTKLTLCSTKRTPNSIIYNQAWKLTMEKSAEKWGPGGRRRPPVGVQGRGGGGRGRGGGGMRGASASKGQIHYLDYHAIDNLRLSGDPHP